jgi:RNA polymerase sigma-70 factor (ECF subfamily)
MDKLNSKKLIVLVKSAKDGDKNAFSELYEYYITPIFRFVFFRVRNRLDAEDLTQNIFLKAWNYLPNYKQKKDPFSSWLYAIARNTIIDFWRKKKDWSISELGENTIKEEKKSIDDLIDEERDLGIIKKLMELLSEDQQEVIVLKFIDGLSGKEISKIINKKEDAVRQLQSRALKTLKEHLKENL